MTSAHVFLIVYKIILPIRWVLAVLRPLTSRIILGAYAALKWFHYKRTGHNLPPPQAYKKATVRHYAQTFGLRSFVETGTYLGNMIAATEDLFEQIYSIELSPELWRAAMWRFQHDKRVRILQGDSGSVLPRLLQDIDTPCLFWLDGHYSGGVTACGDTETPIVAELEAVLCHSISTRRHVVLIDDAQCFTGQHGYPTVEELRAIVAERRPELTFEVVDEIIRIHHKYQKVNE